MVGQPDCHWCAAENSLKDESHPICAISSDKFNTHPPRSAVIDSCRPSSASRFRMFDNPYSIRFTEERRQ